MRELSVLVRFWRNLRGYNWLFWRSPQGNWPRRAALCAVIICKEDRYSAIFSPSVDMSKTTLLSWILTKFSQENLTKEGILNYSPGHYGITEPIGRCMYALYQYYYGNSVKFCIKCPPKTPWEFHHCDFISSDSPSLQIIATGQYLEQKKWHPTLHWTPFSTYHFSHYSRHQSINLIIRQAIKIDKKN